MQTTAEIFVDPFLWNVGGMAGGNTYWVDSVDPVFSVGSFFSMSGEVIESYNFIFFLKLCSHVAVQQGYYSLGVYWESIKNAVTVPWPFVFVFDG